MKNSTIILFFILLVCLVISILSYRNYKSNCKNTDKNTNKSITRSDFQIMPNDNNPINQLVDLVLKPVLSIKQIPETYIIPPELVTIGSITSSVSKYGFATDYAIKDINININNIHETFVHFSQYYKGKFAFRVSINCVLTLGTMSFYNTYFGIPDFNARFLNKDYIDVKIPFVLSPIILFDIDNYANTKVVFDNKSGKKFYDSTDTDPGECVVFDETSISLPDTLQMEMNKYWDTQSEIYAAAATVATATAVAFAATLNPVGALAFGAIAALNTGIATAIQYPLKDMYWQQVKSKANIPSQINAQIPSIASYINKFFNDPNGDFINKCNESNDFIKILFQINSNPWDFNKILCSTQQCMYDRRNYFLAKLTTPFSGTNFQSDQLFIVKSDNTSCYAINMDNTDIEYLLDNSTCFILTPEIKCDHKYQLIEADNNPAVLLRTNENNGTVRLIGKRHFINKTFMGSNSQVSYNISNNQVTLWGWSDPGNGSFTYFELPKFPFRNAFLQAITNEENRYDQISGCGSCYQDSRGFMVDSNYGQYLKLRVSFRYFGETDVKRIVAVGRGKNTIAYSPDGIDWTGLGTSIFSSVGNGITFYRDKWVAVGKGTNTIAYSPDGINWIGLGNIFSSTGIAVACNGTMWVAVGVDNNDNIDLITNSIIYSYNGINWNRLTNTPMYTTYESIDCNNSRWIVGGSGQYPLAYSDDGINWTPVQLTPLQVVKSVKWNGKRWFACGYGSSAVAYSDDGINWMSVQLTPLQVIIPDVPPNYVPPPPSSLPPIPDVTSIIHEDLRILNQIALDIGYDYTDETDEAGITGGKRMVIVGSGEKNLAFSDDEVSWHNSKTDIFQYLQGIIWNGERWVAVGVGKNTISYSNDGVIWTGIGKDIFSIEGIKVAWNYSYLKNYKNEL